MHGQLLAKAERNMEAFAFVDTNLLLHYQLFTEVDWHKQLGVADVTLALAPVVVSGVDDHKWSGARREKVRAKSERQPVDHE